MSNEAERQANATVGKALRNLELLAGLPRQRGVVRGQAPEMPRVRAMHWLWMQQASPEDFESMSWQQRGAWADKVEKAAHRALAALGWVEARQDIVTVDNGETVTEAVVELERVRADSLINNEGRARFYAGGSLIIDEVLPEIAKTWHSKAPRLDADPPRRLQAWADGQACVDVYSWALARMKEHSPAVRRVVQTVALESAFTQRQIQIPGIDDGTVKDRRGAVVGRVVDIDAIERARQGLHDLGTVQGHRLIKHLVHRVHDAYELQSPSAHVVVFDGGWSGLAEVLRYSNKDLSLLQSIVYAGQAVRWKTSEIEVGALWGYVYQPHGYRGRATLELTVTSALVPGWAADTRDKSASAVMGRRLIPELRHEPPTDAVRANEQGAVWTLHRLMLREMVDKAREAVDGMIDIGRDRWELLAHKAGLRPKDIARVLPSWEQGQSDDAPSLIIRDGDRVMLADPHAIEREFIANGGHKRQRAAKRRERRGAKER